MGDEYPEPSRWAAEDVFDVPEGEVPLDHPLSLLNAIAMYVVPEDASQQAARRTLGLLAGTSCLMVVPIVYLQSQLLLGDLSLSAYLLLQTAMAQLYHIPCFVAHCRWGFRPYQMFMEVLDTDD